MVLGQGKELSLKYQDLHRLVGQEQLKFVLDYLQRSQVLSTDVAEETFSGAVTLFANNLRILRSYFPKLQDGSVLFLKASEVVHQEHGSVVFTGSDDWWRRFVEGPFVLQKVPGTHLTMMEGNNLRIVAEILHRHLDDVDARYRKAARHELAM
jgi:thioesterase domain-containing protein